VNSFLLTFRKPFLQLITNNKGNATLMLLGFLGLFIVGGLAQLMKTHDTNLIAVKSLRQNIEVDMVMDQAKNYLRSKGSCRESFAGQPTNGSTNQIALYGCDSVTGICTLDTNHVIVTGAIIPVDQSIVKLESINLRTPTDTWHDLYRPDNLYDPNANMMTLFAEFRFVKEIQRNSFSNIMGMYDIVRSIPIEVKINPTTHLIDSCYYDSNADTNLWVRSTCVDIFGGTIFNSLCTDVNFKGSVSTDGHYCFNEVNSDIDNPGNIKHKDCAKSWYFERRACETLPASGVCSANKVLVGWSAYSSGKDSVSSSGVCCNIRLTQ
jgi:hypothetical protein